MASNPRIQRLRAIAQELPSQPVDYDADEPATQPGVIPQSPPRAPMQSVSEGTIVTGATALERVLGAVKGWPQLFAFVAFLAAAVAVAYLWLAR